MHVDNTPTLTNKEARRLHSKFLLGGPGCWEWTAARTREGYGRFGLHGRRRQAHRVVYQWLVGPVPDGMVLDHLCRNRACVRPDHLEPVTDKVNVLRGEGPAPRNASKTHCLAGHPYDEENTYRRPDGCRDCRACKRLRERVRYHHRKGLETRASE